jgi:hypothetical protein
MGFAFGLLNSIIKMVEKHVQVGVDLHASMYVG